MVEILKPITGWLAHGQKLEYAKTYEREREREREHYYFLKLFN